MHAIVFCQIRLIRGQIHKANSQYQEINKTTRCGFFDMVFNVVICS